MSETVDFTAKKNNILLRSIKAPMLVRALIAVKHGRVEGTWNSRDGVVYSIYASNGEWVEHFDYFSFLLGYDLVTAERSSLSRFRWNAYLTDDGKACLTAAFTGCEETVLREIDERLNG